MTEDDSGARFHPLVVLLIVAATIAVLVFAAQWWQCHQLSPVERMFARGC